MKNPFGPEPDSFHSYIELKKRILTLVRTGNVYNQIFQVVQTAYDEALKPENVLLSSAEKKIMFSQILKAILEDTLEKVDTRSSST